MGKIRLKIQLLDTTLWIPTFHSDQNISKAWPNLSSVTNLQLELTPHDGFRWNPLVTNIERPTMLNRICD
jgi:hypothetical protein